MNILPAGNPYRTGTKARRQNRTVRTGLTLIEMLIALVICSVIMIGVAGVLNEHWQSYQDTLYQNVVNEQARRALDSICDDLRIGGDNFDATQMPNLGGAYAWGSAQVLNHSDPPNNVYLSSGASDVSFYIGGQSACHYYIAQNNNVSYLVRNTDSARTVAKFIKSVHFRYLDRNDTPRNDPNGWTFYFMDESLLTGPNLTFASETDPNLFRVNMVYVTVVAEFQNPHGQTYTRQLTSAVKLRGPYNMVVPKTR